MRDLVRVLLLVLSVPLLGLTSNAPVPALAPATVAVVPRTDPATTHYAVLQTNLCLSGYASCYHRSAYPAVLDEVADEAAELDVDAVTLEETCSGDSARLARRSGLHLRFSAVLVAGAPLACVAPGGRGVFGLAVLTRDAVARAADAAFAAHDGLEERRWLCVTTVAARSVCTAHLGTRVSTAARQANDAECAELRRVLERYDARGATVFGGDVNRQRSCAPLSMRHVRDAEADQLPGIQHVYASSRSATRLRASVRPARHTDHDFLAARVVLTASAPLNS